MLKRLAILALVAVAASALAAPIFAATPLQGSIGGISPADGAALGATVSCRQYSVSGADTGVNQNQCFTGNAVCCTNLGDPTHNADRCIRVYSTNTNLSGGGYVCNAEGTQAYNSDADNQTFYNLIDGELGAGTDNHIGFFAVEGQIASSATPNNPGDSRTAGCAGTTSVNCFTRADSSNADSTPLTFTRASFGPVANQIRSTGGLSPVPTARVTRPGGGGCLATESRLTWDDPPTYSGAMKNGAVSPVLGVNLYRNAAPCGAGPNGSLGWVLDGSFGLGAGAVGVCKSVSAETWFALTVRLKGPGNGPGEIETPKSASSQCSAPAGTVVRIVSLSARYAGRNTVNVNFTSGTEGGVQGYYVNRAASPTGPFSRVSNLMGATGDNSRYTYADHVRANLGRNLYYQVDVMHNDGTVEHSGVTSVTLPSPKSKKLGAD